MDGKLGREAIFLYILLYTSDGVRPQCIVGPTPGVFSGISLEVSSLHFLRPTPPSLWRACGPLGGKGECEDTSRSGRGPVPCTSLPDTYGRVQGGLAFLTIRGMVGRKHGVPAGVWAVPKGLLFALWPPAAASRKGKRGFSGTPRSPARGRSPLQPRSENKGQGESRKGHP